MVSLLIIAFLIDITSNELIALSLLRSPYILYEVLYDAAFVSGIIDEQLNDKLIRVVTAMIDEISLRINLLLCFIYLLRL